MGIDNNKFEIVKRNKKKLEKYYRYPSSRREYLVKLILELVSLYNLILPKYHTINEVLLEYPNLSRVYEGNQEERLLIKLVHYQTLINRVHREQKNRQTYVSDEEDVLAALTILEELVRLSKREKPSDRDGYILSLIKEHVGLGKEFKSRDLYLLLGISKRQLNDSLYRLHELGKVRRVSGHRYIGYVYKLV